MESISEETGTEEPMWPGVIRESGPPERLKDLRTQARQVSGMRECPSNKSKHKSSGGTLQDAFIPGHLCCAQDKARGKRQRAGALTHTGPRGPQSTAVHSKG